MISALVYTSCTRGVQENCAICLVVLQTGDTHNTITTRMRSCYLQLLHTHTPHYVGMRVVEMF